MSRLYTYVCGTSTVCVNTVAHISLGYCVSVLLLDLILPFSELDVRIHKPTATAFCHACTRIYENPCLGR